MKIEKILYWTTTGIVGLMMTYSAYAYLSEEAMISGFEHLGFPDYFRVELAIAKLIGVILLLAPIGVRFKEWTYAGFTIVFISAFIAHSAAGDPIDSRIAPVVFMVLLMISYATFHKVRKNA